MQSIDKTEESEAQIGSQEKIPGESTVFNEDNEMEEAMLICCNMTEVLSHFVCPSDIGWDVYVFHLGLAAMQLQAFLLHFSFRTVELKNDFRK